MKKIEFDILYRLYENAFLTPFDLSKELFVDLDTVYLAIDTLNNNHFLKDLQLTDLAIRYLEDHKIDNAIILAAGMSTRFVPINYETPKGLLKVKGEVLIERQIRQLIEKGIEEIVIVVGYMKDRFQYLTEKYNVTLVESFEYTYKNNHSSVLAAKNFLKNSIVTSSDLYFEKNVFQKYAYDSYYTCVFMEGLTSERGIWVDDNDLIIKTAYGSKCKDVWVTFGYAFFSKNFSKKIVDIMEKGTPKKENYNKFWADFQDLHLKELYMYPKRVANDTIFEFDSLEELRQFDKKYINDSGSVILKTMSSFLHHNESDLTRFKVLRHINDGVFSFEMDKREYLCGVNYAFTNFSNEQYIKIGETDAHIFKLFFLRRK